jgi:glycosyltransferase involved in cell wall biosynthesis
VISIEPIGSSPRGELPQSAYGVALSTFGRTGAPAAAAPPPAESPASPSADPASPPEVSVVMPCLNEAETVATCVSKALRALREAGISGEVIVADNGSTDGSQDIARSLGARVVDVTAKGYGNALMGGIAAARGNYVIMGDADDSYDFLELAKFVERLREGNDLVMGCRLPRGGGRIEPGAMPVLHRWLGNPGFSMLIRWWFHAPISDVYCGMRGFSRAWYESLNQRCTGMEFATEMVIKSARHVGRIAEVPITLHRDGRTSHPPHLKTFRDGWRTLRFFLMHCPKWLFLEPGKWLIVLGLIGFALGLPGLRVAGVGFGLNTLVVSSLAILCGSQAILFALGTKTFAIHAGLMPPDPRIDRFFQRFTLERGAVLSLLALIGGIVVLAVALNQWRAAGFGNLGYDSTPRWAISGALLTAWGFQTLLGSFFISILGLPRK